MGPANPLLFVGTGLAGSPAPGLRSSARSKSRRVVAAIAAFCLGFKILAILFVLPLAPANEGTKVLICAAQGLKWIELDGTGKPASGTPLPDRACPFCLAGAAGLPFVPPTAPRLAVPRLRVVTPAQPWACGAPELCLAARPPPSRGPPLLSH